MNETDGIPWNFVWKLASFFFENLFNSMSSEKGLSYYNKAFSYRKTTLRDEAKKYAAILQEKEKEKEKLLLIEQEKKRQEEELRKFREQQRLQQEKEFKTRRFFDLNNFDHKIAPIGNPYYYGDFQLKFSAWRPHGKGQLCIFDNPLLDGDWVRGNFVKGRITWSDGSYWEGGIQHEVIHGMGKITNPEGETEEAVAVNGEIMVKKSGRCIVCFIYCFQNMLTVSLLKRIRCGCSIRIS